MKEGFVCPTTTTRKPSLGSGDHHRPVHPCLAVPSERIAHESAAESRIPADRRANRSNAAAAVPVPVPATGRRSGSAQQRISGCAAGASRAVEPSDMAALGVVYKQPLLIARETQSIGLDEIIDKQCQSGSVLLNPIDAAEIQFRRTLDAEMGHAPIGRIGKIDPPIALHDDVVWAVELLAPVVGGENVDRAIEFGPGHLAGSMLTGQHPPGAIVGVAIRHVGRFAKRHYTRQPRSTGAYDHRACR